MTLGPYIMSVLRQESLICCISSLVIIFISIVHLSFVDESEDVCLSLVFNS